MLRWRRVGGSRKAIGQSGRACLLEQPIGWRQNVVASPRIALTKDVRAWLHYLSLQRRMTKFKMMNG